MHRQHLQLRNLGKLCFLLYRDIVIGDEMWCILLFFLVLVAVFCKICFLCGDNVVEFTSTKAEVRAKGLFFGFIYLHYHEDQVFVFHES